MLRHYLISNNMKYKLPATLQAFSRKVNALISRHSKVLELQQRVEILENVVNMKQTIKEAKQIVSPVMKKATSPKVEKKQTEKKTKTKPKTLVKKKIIAPVKHAGMINAQLTATNNVILTGFDMSLIDSSLIDGLFISDPYCSKCKATTCQDDKHTKYQKAFVNKTSGTETTKELLSRSMTIAKEIKQQAHSVKGIALKIGGGFS